MLRVYPDARQAANAHSCQCRTDAALAGQRRRPVDKSHRVRYTCSRDACVPSHGQAPQEAPALSPRVARLVADRALCQGCQACMVTCSLLHEGMVIPSLARVQVVLDPFAADHVVHYCHQCGRAPCARACPTGAIASRDAGYWAVDESLCDGCGSCIAACPFGALIMHPHSERALICDTCFGRFECTNGCPTGALHVRNA